MGVQGACENTGGDKLDYRGYIRINGDTYIYKGIHGIHESTGPQREVQGDALENMGCSSTGRINGIIGDRCD